MFTNLKLYIWEIFLKNKIYENTNNIRPSFNLPDKRPDEGQGSLKYTHTF